MQGLRGLGNAELVIYDEAQYQTKAVLSTSITWAAQSFLTLWFLSSVSANENSEARKYLNRRWQNDPDTYVFFRLILDNAGKVVADKTNHTVSALENYRLHLQTALLFGKRRYGGELLHGKVVSNWYSRPADSAERVRDEIRFAQEYARVDEYITIASLPAHMDEASYYFLKSAMDPDEFANEIANVHRSTSRGVHQIPAFTAEFVNITHSRVINRATDYMAQQECANVASAAHGYASIFKPATTRVLVYWDPAHNGTNSDGVIMTFLYKYTCPPNVLQEIAQGGSRSLPMIDSFCNPSTVAPLVVRLTFTVILIVAVCRVVQYQLQFKRSYQRRRASGVLPFKVSVVYTRVVENGRRKWLKGRGGRVGAGRVA